VIPRESMRAAFASADGAAGPTDTFAAMLEFTASQIQPLGEPVDAAGFAMGMLATAFLMDGLDVNQAVAMFPVQFAEFMVRCRAMQDRVVCAHRSWSFPSTTCGLDPGHEGKHAAGRLRW
jgi:hypothetical protein